MQITIIIPVLNEGSIISEFLQALQSFRQQGHEVIVVDGGSDDDTVSQSRPLVDRVVESARGRARQMNTGAALARGDVLVFLHSDTRIPFDLAAALTKAIGASVAWGRFDVRLSGSRSLLRVVEFFMNLRSRLTGIATGDQVIFCTRDLFHRVRGFPEIALMEDIAFSSVLRKQVSPRCLKHRVITSSRRWEEHGILRTVLKMWCLRLAYFFGVDPEVLARIYQ